MTTSLFVFVLNVFVFFLQGSARGSTCPAETETGHVLLLKCTLNIVYFLVKFAP